MKLRSAVIASIVALLALMYSCNQATTQSTPHQSVLNWVKYVAPTGNTATFTLFRGNISGGPYATTVKAGITGDQTTYTDAGLLPNTTYCYVIKVVLNDGSESKNSAEACGTTQKDPVPPVAGFTVVTQ